MKDILESNVWLQNVWMESSTSITIQMNEGKEETVGKKKAGRPKKEQPVQPAPPAQEEMVIEVDSASSNSSDDDENEDVDVDDLASQLAQAQIEIAKLKAIKVKDKQKFTKEKEKKKKFKVFIIFPINRHSFVFRTSSVA